MLVYVQKLTETGVLRIDYVIAEENRKRLIIDEFPGAEDGVPQTKSLLLPGEEDVHHVSQ